MENTIRVQKRINEMSTNMWLHTVFLLRHRFACSPACRVRKLLFLNHPRSDVIKKDDDCLSSSYHPNFRVMDGEALVVAFANPRDDSRLSFSNTLPLQYTKVRWRKLGYFSCVCLRCVEWRIYLFSPLVFIFNLTCTAWHSARSNGPGGRLSGANNVKTLLILLFLVGFFFSGLTKKRNKFSL